MQIPYKKLHPEATAPFRAHPDDAALDLFAVIDGTCHLGPLGIAKIPTGIALAIPPGYCGVVKGRSGLGSNGVNVLGGVIDAGYHGEIAVLLQTARDMAVCTGDKIAQLLIVPVPQATLVEVPEFPTVSERGEKGFGSTDAVPFKGILHGAGQPGPRGMSAEEAQAAGFNFQGTKTGRIDGTKENYAHPGSSENDVAASTALFTPPEGQTGLKSNREAVWDFMTERARQRAKGWDAEHDAQHEPEVLLNAALCYALTCLVQMKRSTPEQTLTPELLSQLTNHIAQWPFEESYWRPNADITRNAVKAGALLAAFIDRLRQPHDENRVPLNPTEREDTDAR